MKQIHFLFGVSQFQQFAADAADGVLQPTYVLFEDVLAQTDCRFLEILLF